ncbi:hypothetical protein WJX84_005986 [Apatococcus fuscideae]|uniref:Peptidase S26 domain-containing protein n=1 Tax=Apatococcus fuscideae TaxID=2026836 RepID=A0AAW1SC61_9CHLO
MLSTVSRQASVSPALSLGHHHPAAVPDRQHLRGAQVRQRACGELQPAPQPHQPHGQQQAVGEGLSDQPELRAGRWGQGSQGRGGSGPWQTNRGQRAQPHQISAHTQAAARSRDGRMGPAGLARLQPGKRLQALMDDPVPEYSSGPRSQLAFWHRWIQPETLPEHTGYKLKLEDPAQQDVLRKYLLQQLSAGLVAHLRATCSSLRTLVDVQTGLVWKKIASKYLNADTLPVHDDGLAVQQRLRLHAECMSWLQTGAVEQELRQLPGPSIMPGSGAHQAFCEQQYKSHAQLFAVDVCSGSINPGPRFRQVPSEARVEHVHLGCDHHPAAALVELKPRVYTVVNLPSMTMGGELRTPASAGIADDWRACWVAWSPIGVILIVWGPRQGGLDVAATYDPCTGQVLHACQDLSPEAERAPYCQLLEMQSLAPNGELAALVFWAAMGGTSCIYMILLSLKTGLVVGRAMLPDLFLDGSYADITWSPTSNYLIIAGQLAMTDTVTYCLRILEVPSLQLRFTSGKPGSMGFGTPTGAACILPHDGVVFHLEAGTTFEAHPGRVDLGQPEWDTRQGFFSSCGQTFVNIFRQYKPFCTKLEHWSLQSGGWKAASPLEFLGGDEDYGELDCQIAWHPQPSSSFIYALYDGMQGIHIIDGWRNFLRNTSNRETSRAWRDVTINALLVGGCVHLVREYIAEPTKCMGPSMLPTFNPRGDVLIQEHLSVTFKQIRVGDVVFAISKNDPRHIVCKRVLGMEGDTVEVREGRQGELRVEKVPAGHVWLQGDNTINSTDSRHYGPVPYAMLVGKAFAKVLPLSQAGWVESRVPSYASSSKI